jgi:hypothetical protein
MPALVPGAELQVSRQIKMDFAFHLVAVHCNVAAFDRRMTIATMIRNHDYVDHSWDPADLEVILEEADVAESLPGPVARAIQVWEDRYRRAHGVCAPDCSSPLHDPH